MGFDLRNFLTENKLTDTSKVLNEATYFASVIGKSGTYYEFLKDVDSIGGVYQNDRIVSISPKKGDELQILSGGAIYFISHKRKIAGYVNKDNHQLRKLELGTDIKQLDNPKTPPEIWKKYKK